MSEQEYDEGQWESWQQSGPTRRLMKANKERLTHQYRKLESAAKRSTDPEVREAMAEVWATKVMIAELNGDDEVKSGGMQ